MNDLHDYSVQYRALAWVNDHTYTVLVRAYSAQDAAFQAMIHPLREAELNNRNAVLLGVAPYEEGMKFDLDHRFVAPVNIK